MSVPSEFGRYHKGGSSAQLGLPIKVTKSKKHCPGGIFTLGTDFKTREWAAFRIDDEDAVLPLPGVGRGVSSTIRHHVPRETPKYHDIVIPVEVSVEDEIGKLPFSTIPIKVVSPVKDEKKSETKEVTVPKNVDIHSQTLPLSSSQSVGSQSTTSQSTRSIFGPRNPMESYSFRGTKLSKKRLEGGRLPCPLQPAMDDDDMFSIQSYESKTSQPQGSSATLNDLLNNSSHDSEANQDWPAHQIHSRMMGWKLTSPERRQGLLRMLASADLSTASMTEEELRLHRKMTGTKKQQKIHHLAKRQTEAFENNVSRLAQHQNKDFKFIKNQQDNLRAKVTKAADGANSASVDRVIRPCGKRIDTTDIFQYDCNDPFASVEVRRAFTAEAAVGLQQRQVERANAQHKQSLKQTVGGEGREQVKDVAVKQSATGSQKARAHKLPQGSAHLSADSTVPRSMTPNFQAVGRNHRDLLNPADRMELLSNARDVERTTATLSEHAARAVSEFDAGIENSFIDAGSPKRGLTGEAYLMSVQSDKIAQRKPILMQTADWQR